MSKASKHIEKLKEINKDLIKLEGLEGKINEYGIYISSQKTDPIILEIEEGVGGSSISGSTYVECDSEPGDNIMYSFSVNPFSPTAYEPSGSKKLRSELLTSKHS